VKGQFVGGNDVMRQMLESGELQDLFNRHSIPMSAG